MMRETKEMRRFFHTIIVTVSALAITGLVGITPAAAESAVTGVQMKMAEFQQLAVVAGESRILSASGLTRAAITNPAIADVVVTSDRELIVDGKSPGQTTLHIWDSQGQRTYVVRVYANIAALVDEVQVLIGLPGVVVKVANRSILLEGVVETRGDFERAERIAKAYSDQVINLLTIKEGPAEEKPAPTPVEDTFKSLVGIDTIKATKLGDTLLLEGMVETENDLVRAEKIAMLLNPKVLNLIEVADPLQVLLQVQVVEVNRSDADSLGVNWGGIVSGDGFEPGALDVGQSFPGGDFLQLSPILARIKALIEQNAAKLLAAPSILTLNGMPANFLVGGEIPVYLGEKDGKVEFEWKPYGVRLEILPNVDRSGRITVKVKPEVSSLDWDNALQVGTARVPALKTRRTETNVVVRDGMTLVLGGLLATEDTKYVNKIPILGDLPIIGSLFRSTRFQKGQTELIIVVTPRIVRLDSPVKPGEVVEPREKVEIQ